MSDYTVPVYTPQELAQQRIAEAKLTILNLTVAIMTTLDVLVGMNVIRGCAS